MIEWFVITAMWVDLILCAYFIRLGGRKISKVMVGGRSVSLEKYPLVAVIAPADGADMETVHCLNSLLSQDYPVYNVIFVTRNAEYAATEAIQRVIQDYPHARHVLSGAAVTCSQKNHNLLTGIREAGDDPEILVFCDSTRLFPTSWLKAIIEPLVRNEAVITTGYHHVIPQEKRIAALAHAITVLSMYLVKTISWLNHPWGGSTAVRRKNFDELKVGEVWSRNVVDDVSLGARLKKEKIKVMDAPGACIFTPLTDGTLGVWIRWLIRQWLYLKFCLPGTWVLGGIVCHLHATLVLVAGIWSMGLIMGLVSPIGSLSAILFFLSISLMGEALRKIHPGSGSWPFWLVAVYLTAIMISWCHLMTLFTRKIHWRGMTYRVTWGGKVIGIEVH